MWVHTRCSDKDRTRRLARRNMGLPFCEHSVALRCQRNPFYSTVLLSNGFHRPKIRLKKFGFSLTTTSANIAKKLPPQRCSKPFFNFSHKRPTFAFTGESGYILGFRRRIAHSGLHAETGAFRTGVVSLPSDRSARFGNPAWPRGRTANFAAFGSWLDVLPKNAESLRNSDVLMRVAVPRRRGPAGLRDLLAIW